MISRKGDALTTQTKPFDMNGFLFSRPEQANISCKSFVVTIFGDVISQHGDEVWLGDLIGALEPLGFSERLIRTSVFRLVKDNWLAVTKNGRKSFYQFTPSAHKHYTKAARRIYAATTQHSDGNWLIVLPSFVDEEELPSFKRQLRWLGFSQLASGAYAHPSIDKGSLEETISELELTDSVVVFESKTIDDESTNVLKSLVQQRWQLELLDQDYAEFNQTYQPLIELVAEKQLNDHQAFLLRGLLIHEYRRVLLKDHELPQNMLPDDWQGYLATKIAKKLYAQLARASARYITSQLQNQSGFLPAAAKSFSQRFK
ncbi:phenylacetic acid degradation operon negative regulatory protein PaaX [Aliikangiella marina]|uniref:Phenylacetic acid degradation operon negative regulatory protein PaaX n=1 Tax=Aliikangiella marina TaxID=1712262 RepID=A0A545T2W8_9GAMM|nr:PaaX family transcriptional regulator C-terminal domain-containing protein [Aliikangiella marina]TQV71525.1 phenylacetic acid degradation operon negative regulatory protein PaaX [Aliikangiella marina]